MMTYYISTHFVYHYEYLWYICGMFDRLTTFARKTGHQCGTMMTYYTNTHLYIIIYVCVTFVVCLIIWLLFQKKTDHIWYHDDYTYQDILYINVHDLEYLCTSVVCLLVWLLLSGNVTTTTLIIHWWRVTRTQKLCWFPCLCITLWLWKYWKFQFEI